MVSVVACLGLYTWVVVPPPPSPELAERSRPVAAPDRQVTPRPAVVRPPRDTAPPEFPDLVDGRVTDEQGQPLADVVLEVVGQVNDYPATWTDTDGLYEVYVQADDVRQLSAWLPEHQPHIQELSLAGSATIDVQLSRPHTVRVHCLGMPDDSCADIEPMFCTRPMLMLGKECRGTPRDCECPGGVVAIRGGGQVVRVEADAHEAWLDFRDDATLMGLVMGGDVPCRGCDVLLVKASKGLVEDLGKGLLLGREFNCDEDGYFEAYGLAPGTWRLMVGERSQQLLHIPFIELQAGELRDLGELQIDQGGSIEGVVVDGLTGERRGGAPVAATPAEEDWLSIPASFAEGGHDGVFEIHGLPEGDYRVFSPLSPLSSERVRVRTGQVSTVTVTLGEDALPKEQGFTLKTGGAGELLVSGLEDDSEAAQAGLREGDVLDGVRLFGVDLRTVSPKASRAVLSRYSGPGVVLLVERDGRSVELDL